MPECTYTATVHAPLASTWSFVAEMDNWAPLLTGYQGHEKQDDTTSIWRLRGDVGMLSREVQLRVAITEWRDGEQVDFTLTGINEQVQGDGTFTITSTATEALTAPPADPQPASESPTGWFARLVAWFARRLFRSQHGHEPALAAPVHDTASPQDAVDEHVELQFRLRMEAGGPMAPMINAMLQPALLPATEELATKIANRVLQIHTAEG